MGLPPRNAWLRQPAIEDKTILKLREPGNHQALLLEPSICSIKANHPQGKDESRGTITSQGVAEIAGC